MTDVADVSPVHADNLAKLSTVPRKCKTRNWHCCPCTKLRAQCQTEEYMPWSLVLWKSDKISKVPSKARCVVLKQSAHASELPSAYVQGASYGPIFRVLQASRNEEGLLQDSFKKGDLSKDLGEGCSQDFWNPPHLCCENAKCHIHCAGCL